MDSARGVPLAPLTTLRLGGPAASLTTVTCAEELEDAVRALDAAGEATLLLAGGSNVVIGDAGFAGTVVRLTGEGVRVVDEGDAVRVTAWAGATWDDLVARAVGEGWSGVEALSGIPGSVGATPLQNVGAYGQEVAETISRVRVFDRDAQASRWILREDCRFAYRSSRFRGRDRDVVLEVELRFKKDPLSAPVRYAELARGLGVEEGARAPLAVVRDTIVRLRRAKGMVVDPSDPDTVSAGSFFTNPIVARGEVAAIAAVASASPPVFPVDDARVKVPAAWLIERAGFHKGFTKGGAAISSKHALALVNRGGPSGDLLALARAIRDEVRARFGVTLEPEPILVGCRL